MEEYGLEKSVFISHSSCDAQICTEICNVIEKHGIKCWIAPRDVTGGMPYAEEIVKAIKETKIVLLVASVSINSSEQILNEIEIAISHSKIILPFKIDAVVYNDSYKYYLNRKHWIEASPDPSMHYSELLKTIDYLLTSKGDKTYTADDQYLISLSERNRKAIIKSTFEKRMSFGLSLEADDNEDKYHFYDKIKRIDVIYSETGKYTSYRWLSITNKSDNPTTYIVHKECGDIKAYFDKMNLRAKQITIEGEQNLIIESQTKVQPNVVQLFKIYFNTPLPPGESITIFYRLEWPNEALFYCEDELSTSISLTRYTKGVGELVFGIMDTVPLYGFELKEINSNFELRDSVVSPTIMKIQDDIDLKPLHGKNISGAYFFVEDAADMSSYRIIYKQVRVSGTDAEEEF